MMKLSTHSTCGHLSHKLNKKFNKLKNKINVRIGYDTQFCFILFFIVALVSKQLRAICDEKSDRGAKMVKINGLVKKANEMSFYSGTNIVYMVCACLLLLSCLQMLLCCFFY